MIGGMDAGCRPGRSIFRMPPPGVPPVAAFFLVIVKIAGLP